ncbi:MAG: hypothetical protein VKP62_12840, partial [Candidatus Sericytochromatia bacterium]|nr:hypothetical protein [Candidatus Sericytochromatia bacterium]
PGAVATVTGTELVVEFDPTRRATEVTVFEGAVDVAGDVGQLVRVLAGTTTRVPIQAPAAAPVPIDDRKLQERNVLFKPLSLNEAPGSPAPAAPEAAPPTDPAAGTRPNRADASVPGPAPGNATQETPPGEPKPAPGAVKPDMKGQTDKLLDPRVINGSPTTGSVRVIIE